jgi:hypothetical protein
MGDLSGLVIAVIADSLITLFVGWRLGQKAEHATKAAAEPVAAFLAELQRVQEEMKNG